MPLVLFGCVSLYSGEPAYDSWMLMCWNTIFTSLPILFFGMFEIDVPANELLQNPILHKAAMKNSALSYGKFYGTLATGVLHSVVMCLVTAYANTTQWIPDDIFGLRLLGMVLYTEAFVLVMFIIMLDIRNWTLLTHFSIWICSFASYFGFLFVYTGIDGIFGTATTQGIYWVGFELMTRDCWELIVLSCGTVLALHFLVHFTRRTYYPTAVQLVQSVMWSKRPSGAGEGDIYAHEHEPLLADGRCNSTSVSVASASLSDPPPCMRSF